MPPKIFTETYIAQRLVESQDSPVKSSRLWAALTDTPRSAAVLIPLFLTRLPDEEYERWHILLTRRTNNVAEHQGQVAFPGGRADQTDTTPEMTALREAYEEIGIHPSQVRILGRMASLQTITNYIVTPIVGVIDWPVTLRLEETEVSRVFSIPLDWLADPNHRETRFRSLSKPLAQILHTDIHPVIFFKPYQDELLWGVSAEITVRLLDLLYEKKGG